MSGQNPIVRALIRFFRAFWKISASFLVTLFLVFSLVLLAGGAPARPQQVVRRGVDTTVSHDPVPVRRMPAEFAAWCGRALHLDLGRSLVTRQPVRSVIGDRLWHTVMLNSYALFLMLLFGLLTGTILTRSRKTDSHPLEWLLYVVYAIPDFVLGILLLLLFSFKLGWFPSHGLQSHTMGQLIHFMTLPAIALAASGTVFLARFTRATLTDVRHAPFVFAMESRGLPRWRILVRIFRNGLIPFLTLAGFIIPALVGGAVVIESLFSFPGIGKTFYDAVLMRDYPVILALTAINTAFVFIGLGCSRMLLYLLDPRRRHEVGG